ncbi:MAG TPA: acetyl-CoA C-acetyltransferase [Thermodesulfobacteriota bacterium]|nr:acetyl-CoA C-acetyltransferase [Thermodesulfobacteriota bacterium]
MQEVYIMSGARTAIGDFGGALKDFLGHQLVVHPMEEAIKRAKIRKEMVEEVILGHCIQRTDEPNTARTAAIKMGLPMSVPAFTVQRQCSSAMQAIASGAQMIKLGEADVVMAGGVETMSSAPYLLKTARWGQRLQHGQMADTVWDVLTDPLNGMLMGAATELLAEKYKITREEMDEVAYRSHKNASRAMAEGRFKDEIVPVPIAQRKGPPKIFDTDEHPRKDLSMEDLTKLPSVFKKGGTVTAGNSSGINDGASAVVLMSGEKAQKLGLKPMARIVSYAWAALEPEYFGYGPVPATQKALQRANLTLGDMELIEVNEAFAGQYMACEKGLGLKREIVNVNGSGIALGHPVGSTGARIVITLLYEMARRGLKMGLATLCVGGGMGMSMIVERM